MADLIDVARLERRVSELEIRLIAAIKQVEHQEIRLDAQLGRIMELEYPRDHPIPNFSIEDFETPAG